MRMLNNVILSGIFSEGAIGSATGTATMAFLGDGATSEGAVNEALVWAGVFEAPLVFFCHCSGVRWRSSNTAPVEGSRHISGITTTCLPPTAAVSLATSSAAGNLWSVASPGTAED